jgi:restriction endonuclease S subunit
MTGFLDLFDLIEKGNFGLTDEAIYKSLQRGGSLVPVYGAYQEHAKPIRFIPENGRTKKNEPITIFEGEGIIINFDGVSAGRMTYKCRERFALNHHTGFLRLKKGAEKLVVPEYFATFCQQQIQSMTVSSDQKTLTTDMIYSLDFELPDYDIQKQVMTRIRPLLVLKQQASDLLRRIEAIKARVLIHDHTSYQAKDAPISELLSCLSGNTGLTEEVIYKEVTSEGQRYSVLSSSTDEATRLGEIPKCYINGRQLEVFENRQGILVIRNGKAGTTFFIESGRYAITDHAYILYLKDSCPYQLSLKWLMIQYRQTFLEYKSSSDNATWNKTGFLENTKIDIPSYPEQEQLVKSLERLETLEAKLREVKAKIDHLTAKQVAAVDS